MSEKILCASRGAHLRGAQADSSERVARDAAPRIGACRAAANT